MDAAKAEKLARLQALIDAVPVDVLPGTEGIREDIPARRAVPQRHPARRAVHTRSDDGVPVGGGAHSSPQKGASRARRGTGELALPPAKAAFQRIVDLCGYQDYSRAKMRERLRREGLPQDAVEDAIDQAVRIGLIDDLRWGEMRACALMRKGMGNAGIVRELKENGISATDIAGWPAALEERFGDELERALRFLEKNPPRSKNPRASAYGKLMRKGFDSGTASRACAIWFDERHACARIS